MSRRIAGSALPVEPVHRLVAMLAERGIKVERVRPGVYRATAPEGKRFVYSSRPVEVIGARGLARFVYGSTFNHPAECSLVAEGGAK